MKESYTGHYEVNTYPEYYNKYQELIRKNFIALSDSRKNHGEWLEHLEELIIDIARTIQVDSGPGPIFNTIGNLIEKYYREMENL